MEEAPKQQERGSEAHSAQHADTASKTMTDRNILTKLNAIAREIFAGIGLAWCLVHAVLWMVRS